MLHECYMTPATAVRGNKGFGVATGPQPPLASPAGPPEILSLSSRSLSREQCRQTRALARIREAQCSHSRCRGGCAGPDRKPTDVRKASTQNQSRIGRPAKA